MSLDYANVKAAMDVAQNATGPMMARGTSESPVVSGLAQLMERIDRITGLARTLDDRLAMICRPNSPSEAAPGRLRPDGCQLTQGLHEMVERASVPVEVLESILARLEL